MLLIQKPSNLFDVSNMGGNAWKNIIMLFGKVELDVLLISQFDNCVLHFHRNVQKQHVFHFHNLV